MRRQPASNRPSRRSRLPGASEPGRDSPSPSAFARIASVWKRSRTLWMRIPKRWLIVGSCGIAKTRANLYLSGQVR